MKQLQLKREDIPALVAKLCKKGARPITVVMRTEKPLLKKDRITGQTHTHGRFVTKVARFSAFLNFDYENSVNLERAREGKEADFHGGSSWFRHKEGDPKPIVRHKDNEAQAYLQLKYQKKLGDTYLLSNGNIVTEEQIAGLLPKKPTDNNQGVDKKVITVVSSLENLMSLTADGCEYEIR